MISNVKFFVSLLVCVVTVYLAIWGFNSCLWAISRPDTTTNIMGVVGLTFIASCVFGVIKFLKGYCS